MNRIAALMKPLRKKIEFGTVNSLGNRFAVILAVCLCFLLQIPQTVVAENPWASLEPIDLLELPLSNLSAVTNETSTAVRKLQEQRQAKDEKTVAPCGELISDVSHIPAEHPAPPNIVSLTENLNRAIPCVLPMYPADANPFFAYPLFATDTQMSLPAEATAEPAPVETEPNPDVEEQVWQSRITAPKDDSYEQKRLELQRIIHHVRSVALEPKQPKAGSSTPTQSMLASEPNGVKTDADEVKEQAQHAATQQANLPYKAVSEHTLKALDEIRNTGGPEGAGLQNAFKLAEVLYRSGRLDKAAVVYRFALQAASVDNIVSDEDKVWMLLQIGNCLKDTNASEAIGAYKQVITEYPNSTWKDMAKSQLELLNWYSNDKPEELILKNSTPASDSPGKTEQ